MKTDAYYDMDGSQQKAVDTYLESVNKDQLNNKISSRSSKRSIAQNILIQQKFRVREDLRTLELAILDKDNIVSFNRELIHRIYRRVLQDSHIKSQWCTRKLKTLKKEFFIFKGDSDEPDEELTELFSSPWFYKFMDLALDSMAWGFSLIEFGIWDGKAFKPYRTSKKKLIHEDLMVVDRDYVKPEYGIVTNTTSEVVGIDFTEDRWKSQLIFLGGISDGWLYEASKPYLIKENVLKNWSEFAELFGMDLRFMKTEAEGTERKKLENQLKSVVGGGTMIAGIEDDLEYIGTGRSDAHDVFEQLVNEMNSTLSNLIFGQDVISNNTGRVVGQIGENVSNIYGDSDARFLKFEIEDKLFPLLIKNGVPLENCRFEWGTRESLTLKERAEIDFKIAQMGFEHSVDYINETYDVNVDESDSQETIQNRLKALYETTS